MKKLSKKEWVNEAYDELILWYKEGEMTESQRKNYLYWAESLHETYCSNGDYVSPKIAVEDEASYG